MQALAFDIPTFTSYLGDFTDAKIDAVTQFIAEHITETKDATVTYNLRATARKNNGEVEFYISENNQIDIDEYSMDNYFCDECDEYFEDDGDLLRHIVVTHRNLLDEYMLEQ